MSTEATEPQIVRSHGVSNPRRAVIYSSRGRPVYRGLTLNDEGRLVVIGEADEILSVRLDFSQMVEVDEWIEHVTCTGPAHLQNYDKANAVVTFNNFSCPADVTITVRFSSHEQIQCRFVTRLSQRGEPRTGHVSQIRGVVR
jgi:hypothetical protein